MSLWHEQVVGRGIQGSCHVEIGTLGPAFRGSGRTPGGEAKNGALWLDKTQESSEPAMELSFAVDAGT